MQRVAEGFQCSYGTARKQSDRYRAGEPMTDHSSRPLRSPNRNRTPTRLERRILGLRVNRRWGPHRIGYHLGVTRSTVERVTRRCRMPLLRATPRGDRLEPAGVSPLGSR